MIRKLTFDGCVGNGEMTELNMVFAANGDRMSLDNGPQPCYFRLTGLGVRESYARVGQRTRPVQALES